MTLTGSVPAKPGSQLLLSELDDNDQIIRQFDWRIVPDHQADPAESAYGESLPASQAVLGKTAGEIVETTIDDQPVRLRVQAVENTSPTPFPER